MFIDRWVDAVRSLSENAETLLPGDDNKIGSDSGNPVTKAGITTHFVTGNAADTINPSAPVRWDAREGVSDRPPAARPRQAYFLSRQRSRLQPGAGDPAIEKRNGGGQEPAAEWK